MNDPTPIAGGKPFAQNWIQALTLAADNPVARTIKPKMELIDRLCHKRGESDQVAAAKELWDYAAEVGLTGLVSILPASQARWVFDAQDIFLYERVGPAVGSRDETPSLAAWSQAMGLQPCEVALIAEVTGGDWASLVRREAVRLQKPLNMSAVAQASTLQLPCTARWDTNGWTVQFDQIDWIRVGYDDLPCVARPSIADLEEILTWAIASANDSLLNRKAAPCVFKLAPQPWLDCIESCKPLHQLLAENEKQFSPWLARIWNCVWPIVYREHNVLREKANLEFIRVEIRACLAAQPRLSLWMFVFAKLVCQLQIGTGLGICADYRD